MGQAKDWLLLCLLAVTISNNWKCMVRTCAHITDNSFLIAQGVHSTQKKSMTRNVALIHLDQKRCNGKQNCIFQEILDPNMHSMLALCIEICALCIAVCVCLSFAITYEGFCLKRIAYLSAIDPSIWYSTAECRRLRGRW